MTVLVITNFYAVLKLKKKKIGVDLFSCVQGTATFFLSFLLLLIAYEWGHPPPPPIRNLLHLVSMCELLRWPLSIEVQLFKVMLEDFVAVEPGKRAGRAFSLPLQASTKQKEHPGVSTFLSLRKNVTPKRTSGSVPYMADFLAALKSINVHLRTRMDWAMEIESDK